MENVRPTIYEVMNVSIYSIKDNEGRCDKFVLEFGKSALLNSLIE